MGSTVAPGDRYCSYDGDADRIVYYYVDQGTSFFRVWMPMYLIKYH